MCSSDSYTTNNAILFHDKQATTLAPDGARYRQATASETPDDSPQDRQWRGIIEVDGQAAASGGVMFHYNRPYGDIYMEVAEPFRRRGFGSYIVQELKRLCYETGSSRRRVVIRAMSPRDERCRRPASSRAGTSWAGASIRKRR
jgi:GNAT superfamily N-acetyltransferase